VEKDCDLVVLGGGGSGLVAAARAAWLSGKKVIVVEKEEKTGGGAWYAADFKVFNSRWQKERGIPDVLEESLRAAMDETHWRLSPELARNCFQATGQFFDWLCHTGDGVEEQFREGFYIFDGPNGPKIPVFKKMRYGKQGGTGKFVMDQMLTLCQQLGVEVLTGHEAVEIFAQDHRVTGVLVKDPGGYTRITCQSCVLATGSWINDQKLLEQVDPLFAQMKPVRSAHRSSAYTGDGIRLARQAGAKLDYDSFCLRLMGPLLMAADNTPYQTLAAMNFDPSVIFVNLLGQRWINEQTGPRKGFFDTAIPLREQPEGVSFTLFDANCIEHAIARAKAGDGPHGPFGPPVFPEDWKADMAGAVEEYSFALKQADTLEELAQQMGVSPEALKATIDRYNAMCETGKDTDFCKTAGELVPLCKAPYYALRCSMATDGAFGGVPVDPQTRAIAQDGTVMENLYVTGDFASGRFINQGGVKKQIINDLAWAFASGFLAGTYAAQKLG
jgi:fumarate reductase flavoprotein subunit